MHLQKETNYHTMPRFCENVFDHLSLDILYVLYPVCTIHLLPPVGVLAQLSWNSYGLSGRKYANTWGEDMRNRFFCRQFVFDLLLAGSVWPALSGSDRSSAFDSTVGQEFGKFLKLLSRILFQHHHRPYCQVLRGRRKACFSGNSLLSGATQGLI